MSGSIKASIPEHHIGLIEIDRPEKRNALTQDMIAALKDAFDTFDADANIRAIILTGAGDKAFCAGHDIKAMASDDLGHLYEEEHMQVFLRPREIKKPVIAALNGAAYAGGFCLAIASDIRLATPAVTFGVPGPRLGIVPVAGQSSRLPHLLPAAIVNEMIMTGTSLAATRAFQLGFVNDVVEQEMLMKRAMDMASAMAKQSPFSLQSYKRIAQTTLYKSVQEADAMEYWLGMAAGQRDDVHEGLAAFAERRDPIFKDLEADTK